MIGKDDCAEDDPRPSDDEGEAPLGAGRIELDKIPGFWVVTGWTDDVVLRLKIPYNAPDEPFTLLFEIREPSASAFQLMGSAETCLDQSWPATRGASIDCHFLIDDPRM